MQMSLEWLAIGREADLAVQQLSSGITALGIAHHAKPGLYTQAFFGLSVGIERTAKLIIIADYLIENAGKFPSNLELRKYRHNLEALLDHCDSLSEKYRKGKESWERPNDAIHRAIISTLSEFSTLTRYYNLDFLSGGEASKHVDPVKAWWEDVGLRILDRHFSANKRKRLKEQSLELSKASEATVSVRFQAEDGSWILNLGSLMIKSAETEVVQRYGRLYTLQIVRWLSWLVYDLSHLGADKRRIEPLYGLHELFVQFMQEDQTLRTRKRWPLV